MDNIKSEEYEITVVKTTVKKVEGHPLINEKEKLTESYIIQADMIRGLNFLPEIELAGLRLTLQEVHDGKKY